jgi:hypothetical protein
MIRANYYLGQLAAFSTQQEAGAFTLLTAFPTAT